MICLGGKYMSGSSHFSGRWRFAAFLCIGISLLNVLAWSAEPDSEEEWKPPKLPEAVTIKTGRRRAQSSTN